MVTMRRKDASFWLGFCAFGLFSSENFVLINEMSVELTLCIWLTCVGAAMASGQVDKNTFFVG